MKKCFLFLALALTFALPQLSFAQEGFYALPDQEGIEEEIGVGVVSSNQQIGRIQSIEEDPTAEFPTTIATIEMEDGSLLNAIITEDQRVGTRWPVEVGQRVRLQVTEFEDGTIDVYFIDVVRSHRLFWIAALFALTAIIVGRKRGFLALIGIGITFAVLFLYIFPQILGGADPVLTTVIGSVLILGLNMHLSHGINKHTFGAFLSTMIGLALVCLFAKLFVSMSYLSGLAHETSGLLLFELPDLNTRGLLLAGIILGAVGVLDDIAITQSETVSALLDTNPDLPKKNLFKKALSIGRHHIASVVNTLVLAYIGVAMPLFLLFLSLPEVTLTNFLNEELIGEEIVRTIAGTMGLILVVPISTWIAVWQHANTRDKMRQN